MTTTWGVGVAEGDGDGEGLGDIGEAVARAGVAACAAPHAVKAKARTEAIIRTAGARIVARGFYERDLHESIRGVLTFRGQ